MRTNAKPKSSSMDARNIIMSFSVPPSAEDLSVMAAEILENMPDELVEYADDIAVQKKIADEDDMLMLFRRPILDMWCETGEDLFTIMRSVVIEEIARYHDFADDEIDVIVKTHHQAML